MLPRRLLLLLLVRLGMRQHLTGFFASGKYAADRLERSEVKKEKVFQEIQYTQAIPQKKSKN